MRLLGVQPVFGLIEDAALRTVYNPGCYLFATVGGETMQEDGVRCGEAHQLLVYLIGGEFLLALLGLGLLAHAGPHIGVDDPRAGDSFLRVFGEGRGDARGGGELRYSGVWGVAGRVSDGQLRTGEGAAQSQGVGDVVAVPDVGDLYAL